MILPTLTPTGSLSEQVAALTRINIDDMVSALGLGGIQRGRSLLEVLVRRPAQRFAQQVATYDAIVGAAGLAAGHAWILEQFVKRVEVRGAEHVPRTGPLLIVANHPGLTDGSALLAHLPRRDVRVIAANHAFLRLLPETSRYLLFLADPAGGYLRVIRAAARHLRHGGAVLLFPGGGIEPDPALPPGAIAALDRWSTSVEVFARLEPELAIVPAVISGVRSRKAMRHPLLYVRRVQSERARLATILQTCTTAYHDTVVQLQFGPPIYAASLSSTAQGTVHAAVLSEVRGLMEPHILQHRR